MSITQARSSVQHPNVQVKKNKFDISLIFLSASIFVLLIYAAYIMQTILSIYAIIIAAGGIIYQISSRGKPLSGKFKESRKTLSPTSLFILSLPAVLPAIALFDGLYIWDDPSRIIVLWGLTMTFWSTMMFIPLSVQSKFKETRLPELVDYPAVSIIVPAYNEEKVIASTINGLLETKYPKKEIIVVDDGSTDTTFEIANTYSDKVKVLRKENGGKSSALNLGLQFAKSDIVIVVDADTIVSRNAITELLKGFSLGNNISAIAGNIKVRNRVNWLTNCQALEYILSIQLIRRAFDYFGSITIVPGPLGAFKAEALRETGYYSKDTLAEDFDTTLNVLKSGHVISGSTKAISYTEAPENLRDFAKQRKRWYRGDIQVMTKHKDILFNPRYSFAHKISFPYAIFTMFIMPFIGIVTIAAAIIAAIQGDIFFVVHVFMLFVIMQYLQSALAIRIDGDEMKLVRYSIFFIIGYKQLVDFLILKGIFESLLRRKSSWTVIKRVGITN